MAKNRPVGVSILSVLAYIGAVFLLLGGIGLFVGGEVISSYLSSLGAFSGIITAIGIVAGIILIALAVLYFFIGRGLWKGQNWARIVVLIFIVIGLIGSLVSIMGNLASSIVGIIIDVVIIWYLGFNQEAKSYFK